MKSSKHLTCLYFQFITWKSCAYESFTNSTLVDNKCGDKEAKTACVNTGGRCQIDIDGYYIEVAFNVVYGLIWYQWGKRTLDYLQNLQRKEWHVLSSKAPAKDEVTPLDDWESQA